MRLSMAPYICIWLAARDLSAVAPDWTQAENVAQYGWLAFAFAVGGIVIYFLGLICTHLAAFRTASNIRKQGVARVMKLSLIHIYFSLSIDFLYQARVKWPFFGPKKPRHPHGKRKTALVPNLVQKILFYP